MANYPDPFTVINGDGLGLYYVWTPPVQNYTAVGYAAARIGNTIRHIMIAFSNLTSLETVFPMLFASVPIAASNPGGSTMFGGSSVQWITAKMMDCPNIRTPLPANVPFDLVKKAFQNPDKFNFIDVQISPGSEPTVPPKRDFTNAGFAITVPQDPRSPKEPPKSNDDLYIVPDQSNDDETNSPGWIEQLKKVPTWVYILTAFTLLKR